jgi:uncharacterized repeat protein (TIGR01451 family)
MTLALLLSVFSAANVGAHTVAIETTTSNVPSRTDWFGLEADTAGEGIIQRNRSQQGEFIFNDAIKDQRLISTTSVVTRAADLNWFGVTADANNVYFIAKVERYNGITQSPSIELIITIDTDHVSSSVPSKVELPLGTNTVSQTSVPSDAAWEYAIDTKFSPGSGVDPFVVGGSNTTRIWTNSGGTQTAASCNASTCPSQLAGAAVNQGSFMEVAVPWAQIGGKPATSVEKFLRFTVATMYSNNPRSIPLDGYNSPIIDVLGTTNNTLADIQDGTINTSFDVHFDTNPAPITPTYEPYAPVLVSEFQANPAGTDSPGPTNGATDTEWVEVYNPNSFSINLTNYKIGTAAKRGSGQGMFKFKNNTVLASKGTLIVAKEKSRFVAGHPAVSPSIVYDATKDLTAYTPWSSGTTLDLNNNPTAPATTFEEQVLLLDQKDSIIDLVNYGNPTVPYPGNIPIFTTGIPDNGGSYERCPATLDTNGGYDRLDPALDNTDFVLHATVAEETPGAACVGRDGIDMALNKTASASNARPNTTVVFTLSYSNIGTQNEPSGGVVISDTLPTGLTYQSSSSNGVALNPTINGKNLRWTVNAPNAGGIASTILVSATIDANVAPNTALVNRASVSSTNELPAKLGNNVSEATVTTIGPAVLGLSFDKLAGKTPPNTTFSFNINYSNLGQDDAADTTITLDVPANVSIQSVSSTDATPNFGTPINGPTSVTWTISNLVSGANGTITINAKVLNAPDGTTLPFTVHASSATADPQTIQVSGARTVAFNPVYLPLMKK